MDEFDAHPTDAEYHLELHHGVPGYSAPSLVRRDRLPHYPPAARAGAGAQTSHGKTSHAPTKTISSFTRRCN